MRYPRSMKACIGMFGCLMAAMLMASPSAAGTGLDTQARDVAKSQLAKMGPRYSASIDRHRHIVYISALDESHLRQTQNLLACYIDAQKKTLFDTPTPFNITVVLPTIEDYKQIAATESTDWASGFYQPSQHRLTSIDRGEVLIHEFTHALHHADCAVARQQHPPWICEGLATLFQVSRITPSGLEPLVEPRLITLRQALREDDLIPLATLFDLGQDQFLERPGLAYAESRYVMFYLWQKGRLDSFYKRYKAGFAGDPSGARAFEATLQSRLFLIEPDFKKWVKTLKLPLGYTKARRARLGVEVQDDPRGVKVVGLVPGGVAKEAGRIRVGDVIAKFNETEVTNPASFFGAVKSAGAMRTATVQIIRHGRPQTIQQPLGGHGLALTTH